MPHSNILLAIGAAILLMNAIRIWGSPRSIWISSCSRCDFGLPRASHSCSQVADSYFWMTWVAAMSRIGNWAAAMPATSTANTPAMRHMRITITFSFQGPGSVWNWERSEEHPSHLVGAQRADELAQG